MLGFNFNKALKFLQKQWGYIFVVHRLDKYNGKIRINIYTVCIYTKKTNVRNDCKV